MLFSPDELQQIQLNDKIFIDGHYYRINNIKSFNLVKEASTEIELIKAPIRKFKFPVRRVYNILGPDTGVTGSNGNDSGGQFDDITLDDGSIGADGSGIYVNVDDGLPPTGSGNQGLVGRVAAMDGFNYYPNVSASVNIVTVTPQDLSGTRRNFSLGKNDIDFSAYHVHVLGNGNSVAGGVRQSTIIGNNNTIDSNTENIHVYGSNNSISGSVRDTFLVGGRNNTVTNVSQSLIFNPANGITISNTSNIIALNPIDDIDGTDQGRVVIGNVLLQGNQFENYENVTVGPGTITYLTGSHIDHYHHNFLWSGSNGTALVYLPDPGNPEYDGLKMYFTTGDGLTGSKSIGLAPVSGSIDGVAEKVLTTPYDGLECMVLNNNWQVIAEKKK